MASLRRLGEDAVALGAAGIVIGTLLAALRAPLLVTVFFASLLLMTRLRYRALFACVLLVIFLVAPLRGVGERAPLVDPLSSVRDGALAPLVATLSGDTGALAAGLTLGDDQYFSREFRDAMRTSATTHLVALSGFNVTLMLGFARSFLRGRVRRRIEVIAGIGVLLFFVALAGLQPSLVRAALMGATLLLGMYLGRRVAPARLMLMTAAVMLLFEPAWITHLGFILSFISSWALLAMFGDVERILASGAPLLRTLRDTVAPTVVAQLGVAPALLASVGSVSLIGFVINPLIIPLTPLVTALSGAQLLLSHIAPGVALVMSPLMHIAIQPVVRGIELAAQIPLSVSFTLPVSLAVAFYAASVAWSLKYRTRLW